MATYRVYPYFAGSQSAMREYALSGLLVFVEPG
jgi:hypothetical protein